MEGIVTITIRFDTIDSASKTRLDAEMTALGLDKKLPASEGGDLQLPENTYGSIIEIDDPMIQLKHFYRSFIDVMRKMDLHGSYFVNVSHNPCYCCGHL